VSLKGFKAASISFIDISSYVSCSESQIKGLKKTLKVLKPKRLRTILQGERNSPLPMQTILKKAQFYFVKEMLI
jgi:hypothetical protein